MTQQINLFDPILLKRTRYFTAQAMAVALAVLIAGGGALCGYSVYRLNVASTALRELLRTQSEELDRLHQMAAQANSDAGPLKTALAQELVSRRVELRQKETLLNELQRGLFQPGWGHAARLQLIAETIPAEAWVTAIKADESQLDISGFTLAPEQLNKWIADLGASPLLQGQQLATITVEKTSEQPAMTLRPLWSFRLVSAVAIQPINLGIRP